MVWNKMKTGQLLRRMRYVMTSVEVFDCGVCQLEAKLLDVLSLPYPTREMQAEVDFLTEMTNLTADSIDSMLRGIERTIKYEVEGAPDAKFIYNEFVTVLRTSLRILNQYRSFQQSCADELNRKVSISPSPTPSVSQTGTNAHKPDKLNSVQDGLVHLIRLLCACLPFFETK